jgi:hypothetical protein
MPKKVMKNKVERTAIPLTRDEWYAIIGALNHFIGDWELELGNVTEVHIKGSISQAIEIATAAKDDIAFFVSLEEAT